jgi:hypothetical protein
MDGKDEISVDISEALDRALQIVPMTGAEIVKAGLTGGWERTDVAEGAIWVRRQRKKRREQRYRAPIRS